MISGGVARFRHCALLALGLVSLLGAWRYEQVEPAGNWAWVELEVMPAGTICVCYQDSVSGHIFVARKDSVWNRDDLGRWGLAGPPPLGPGRHIMAGPLGFPAVLLEADTAISYAVLADTGWAVTTDQWPTPTRYARLAFDSFGNPSLVWEFDNSWGECLATSSNRQGTWETDTVYWQEGSAIFFPYLAGLWEFRLGPRNQFSFMWAVDRTWTGGSFSDLNVNSGQTGAWTTTRAAGGSWIQTQGISMAPNDSPGFVACYDLHPQYGSWAFYCAGETIETLQVGDGRIRVDALGRRQIVYRLGVLKHAYDAGRWHIDTLPEHMNSPKYDFATDLNSLPLVAFVSTDGIFLATGDALGVGEEKPQARREPMRLPTIVRGVLEMPRKSGTAPVFGGPKDTVPIFALLDLTGRKVLNLRPGVNDVSGLAPGIYFVRSGTDREEPIRIVKLK